MQLNVAYFSPQIARALREHGVKIWEVTDWRFTCDYTSCYVDNGLPVFMPVSKILIVKIFNQREDGIYEEEKVIYLSEPKKVEEIMRSTKKLAKMLYKEYKALYKGQEKSVYGDRISDFPRWRDLSRQEQGHFIRAAKAAIRGL